MPTESEWANLLQRMSVVETCIKSLCENDLPHIREELQWIRDRLNRGYRPPWSVATLIAFLASLSVGLTVALLK